MTFVKKFGWTAAYATLVSLTPAAGLAVAGNGQKQNYHHGHDHHKPHHGHHAPNYHWHVPQYNWAATPRVYVQPAAPACSVVPVTCVQPTVSPCAQAAVLQAAAAPESNELPRFEGMGMTIMNTESREVSFTLDGKNYKLRPGFQLDFGAKPAYTIVFDRGGKLGAAKYAVQDGKTYRFRAAADTGWDLKATTRALADAAPLAAPPADEP